MTLLYQDDHLLLCEKPVGLLAQEDAAGGDSLPLRLAALTGGPVWPVHRLDRDTGGLMVYARSQRAAALLSEAIRTRAFRKEYLCIVRGTPALPRDTLEDLLYWDAARGKSFPVKRERKGVKTASLSYRLLAEAEGTALLLVELHTGRTHQVRVQFASRRLPLVNDRRYGDFGTGPLALWSCRLAFRHPITGKPLDFTLSPPKAEPWLPFLGTDGALPLPSEL